MQRPWSRTWTSKVESKENSERPHLGRRGPMSHSHHLRYVKVCFSCSAVIWTELDESAWCEAKPDSFQKKNYARRSGTAWKKKALEEEIWSLEQSADESAYKAESTGIYWWKETRRLRWNKTYMKRVWNLKLCRYQQVVQLGKSCSNP